MDFINTMNFDLVSVSSQKDSFFAFLYLKISIRVLYLVKIQYITYEKREEKKDEF